MPHVYLPQILWHSKDNKRSDRIYSIDIQPYPNYYSVKKLNKRYELFKKFLKDKQNKYEINCSEKDEASKINEITLSSNNTSSPLKKDKDTHYMSRNNSINHNNENYTSASAKGDISSIDGVNVNNLMKEDNDYETNSVNKIIHNNSRKGDSPIPTTLQNEDEKKKKKQSSLI
ncbi:chromatin assembly factor 1 subunit A [Plasmodium brasilianum]|uniref:Chromatin assembly factor 1 subunit A n=1 Tax=Plasmodium brasilianum TaxID=5824 RepID=A0ACB9YDU1_PLABR|nr:chromatin assembly factor 1 subunit A [Plasmodium brasilianum]